MPDEKKLDPFKPQQPTIPGVSSSAEKNEDAPAQAPARAPAPQLASAPPIVWMALTAVGALIVAGGLFYRNRNSSPKPVQPTSVAAEVAAPSLWSLPSQQKTCRSRPAPLRPRRIWRRRGHRSVSCFAIRCSSDPVPAIVVRLPRGEYWGFSLREPYGNCELEYISDLEKLRTEYKFHADHPMVGDPCNHTVYDLLRYGGGESSDALVRGAIAQGNGLRPPIAIEIRTQGNQIVAVREGYVFPSRSSPHVNLEIFCRGTALVVSEAGIHAVPGDHTWQCAVH